MVLDSAAKITVIPLPSGDFEARSGTLSARGATAAEAEALLLDLFRVRWDDTHLEEKPPIVDEDQVLEQAVVDEGG